MAPLIVMKNWSWDKEIPVPIETIQYVDQAVLDILPPGTKELNISPSGASFWVRTAKIEAVDENGEETAFFIKVNQDEKGKKMVSAECEVMTAIHKVMPEIVAEPIGWGTYRDMPDIHFFVVRYRELTGEIPDATDFPQRLAELHKRSALAEPRFGYPTVSYAGNKPHWFPVTDSWEDCFARALARDFEVDEQVHGLDPKYTALQKTLFAKAIPRLLRPLETEGRHVTPVLIHGDIWDGNVSVDANTGESIIFDAVSVYAHNEYDLAPWWAPRHKMTSIYIEEYVKHYPKSEPAEDFADRGRLYNLAFDLHASTLYPGSLRRRELVMDHIRYLVNKYPDGYEGYIAEKRAADNPEERPSDTTVSAAASMPVA